MAIWSRILLIENMWRYPLLPVQSTCENKSDLFGGTKMKFKATMSFTLIMTIESNHVESYVYTAMRNFSHVVLASW